ncbi:MAG: hypothetical protein H8E31_10105 [Planctomycetes bacterium]|nr:hypothetical protein [Planctomycetota bacterium]
MTIPRCVAQVCAPLAALGGAAAAAQGPPPGSKVHLLGRERELPWSWADGRLRIRPHEIGPGELPCDWARTFRVARSENS